MTVCMKFFPTGNADITFIQLANNDIVLMDCADTHSGDPSDKRIELSNAIREPMDDAEDIIPRRRPR